MTAVTTLRTLLADSRDGEWGKSEAAPGRRRMRVIRGTDFPSVRVGDLSDVPERFLEDRHAERKRLTPWDILLETAGGSPDRPTGRTLLIKPSVFERIGADITCASFARFLRVDPSKAEPQFVYWLLQYHYESRHLLQYHTQHTGVARFQFTTFADNFRLSLPDRPIQRRVASILGAYDDLIEVNRRRIAVSEEMAHRLFEEWFVDLRFPGHAPQRQGELPRGWSRVPIEQVYDGLYDGPHATPKPSDTGPVFLGIGNITESGGLDLTSVRHISEDDYPAWTRRVTPRVGDIVFTYEATLNRYAMIPPGFRGCLGRRLALIRTDPTSAYRYYLYLYFFSSDWRETIRRNTLSGATVDRIPLSKLPQFPVNLPPEDVASKFDRIVCPIFEAADALRRANGILQASRDLLIPRLVSGELLVTAAKPELENAA